MTGLWLSVDWLGLLIGATPSSLLTSFALLNGLACLENLLRVGDQTDEQQPQVELLTLQPSLIVSWFLPLG